MEKDQNRTARRLTYDELKAAEAAFQGWPLNDAWSEAAQTVYRGILIAKMKLNYEQFAHDAATPKDDRQRTAVVVESIDAQAEESFKL